MSNELTIPITLAPLTKSYLDELWEQPHNETEDALLLHIYAMQAREAKLRHALEMLSNDSLSPKQRRRIIDGARSEYPAES